MEKEKKKTRGSKTNRDISKVDVWHFVIKYSGRKMVRVIIPRWVSSRTFDAQDLLWQPNERPEGDNPSFTPGLVLNRQGKRTAP